MSENRYILTLSCADRPGIVADVATSLAQSGANIVEAQQFDDELTGRFFMRVEFVTEGAEIGPLRDRFESTASNYALPLPPHIDMRRVLETIAVGKDVDGFHLYNVGGLVIGGTVFSPCTPYGVIKLLESESIPIAGQNVVSLGQATSLASRWH